MYPLLRKIADDESARLFDTKTSVAAPSKIGSPAAADVKRFESPVAGSRVVVRRLVGGGWCRVVCGDGAVEEGSVAAGELRPRMDVLESAVRKQLAPQVVEASTRDVLCACMAAIASLLLAVSRLISSLSSRVDAEWRIPL